MFVFKLFDFSVLWSPGLFIILVLIWAVTMLVTTQKSERICMTIALLLFYIVKGSPLDLYGHISFLFHMIQMGILFIVIPPFLWHGLPLEWVRKIAHNRLFLFFSNPIIALLLFNGLFSFYHVPMIFDFVKVDVLYHNVMTAILFVLAFVMWWHIFDRVDNGKNISGLPKLAFIFGNGILLTPACALIILANHPLYATYYDPSKWLEAMMLCVSPGTLQNLKITGPEMFLGASILQDQQNGGVIMKILQEIVYGVFLGITFFKWIRVERGRAEAETDRIMKEMEGIN